MLKDISWRYFDFWLLGAVVLATAFGTTMIRSAVAGNEELLPLINRQIYFALVGLVADLRCCGHRLPLLDGALPSHFHCDEHPVVFPVPERAGGVSVRRAGSRWACCSSSRPSLPRSPPSSCWRVTSIGPRTGRATCAGSWSLPVGDGLAIWILLQPNLSNVVVLMVILASLLWFNGIQIKHLPCSAASALLLIGSIVALSVAASASPFCRSISSSASPISSCPTRKCDLRRDL
jgi:hypothetical protein